MKTKVSFIYLFLGALIIVNGCRPDNSSNTNANNITDPVPRDEQKSVFITDIKGNDWDITHAVNRYDMKARWFHFGLGVGAIPSADNPRVVSQDSPDFPESDHAMEIFGTDIAEDQRAYARYELARHEIFNDVYQNSQTRDVAVGYCPLFNLAAVFSRNLEGRRLTFAPSGWTYGEHTGKSLFVLVDKETLSLWFPMTIHRKSGLYCIAGEFADKYLPEIQQLQRKTWTEWLEANPNTRFVWEN